MESSYSHRKRLNWLEHVLADPDAGRFYTRLQLTAMAEELEHLQAIQKEEEQSK